MYRTIIVPLDGSRSAEFALPWALTLAEASQARLILVSVAAEPRPDSPEGRGVDDPMEWRDDKLQRISGYMETMARRIGESAANITVETEVEAGLVLAVLDDKIRRLGGDLVVMTTHGRGPLRRLWLGSVADGLLRTGPAPILLLRPGESWVDLTARPRVGRILVPLDGSGRSEDAIPHAMELARRFGARLSLVTVVPPTFPVTSPFGPDEETRVTNFAGFRRYLEALGEPAEKLGIPLDLEVVEARNVASGVLEGLERSGADLVVMSGRGRSGIARLLLGSVSDEVVRSGSVPVLLYPPPREGED